MRGDKHNMGWCGKKGEKQQVGGAEKSNKWLKEMSGGPGGGTAAS